MFFSAKLEAQAGQIHGVLIRSVFVQWLGVAVLASVLWFLAGEIILPKFFVVIGWVWALAALTFGFIQQLMEWDDDRIESHLGIKCCSTCCGFPSILFC